MNKTTDKRYHLAVVGQNGVLGDYRSLHAEPGDGDYEFVVRHGSSDLFGLDDPASAKQKLIRAALSLMPEGLEEATFHLFRVIQHTPTLDRLPDDVLKISNAPLIFALGATVVGEFSIQKKISNPTPGERESLLGRSFGGGRGSLISFRCGRTGR